MVVRGVPERLAKDAWWLDEGAANPVRWLPGVLLLTAVALADALIWNVSAGLGLIVWIMAVGAAAQIILWDKVSVRRSVAAWATLLISLIPAVDLVQALSILFALSGLLAFAAIMALGRWDVPVILRAMLRLPGAGVLQNMRDVTGLRVSAPSTGTIKASLCDWLIPLGIGAVFVVLMAAANPVVDVGLQRFGAFDPGVSVSFGRLAFWAVVLCMVWPFLRLAKLADMLGRAPVSRTRVWRSGLLNDRSVLRALVLFNMIFAVQTTLDVGYLWGGVGLPDGMTYADYAHRGAYPLLATALLAGLFALLTQRFLEARPVLRALLYLWVAQTVLLVISSILRLDLYVDAYGLTRLRFAAFIWMVLVALGLVLMIMQMVGRQTVGWFMLRAAGLGLIALYGVSLVNVDGFIARHNLAAGKADPYYLCDLSEGAAPAVVADGQLICGYKVSPPDDWREWGFRNARLRRSLAAMNEVQG